MQYKTIAGLTGGRGGGIASAGLAQCGSAADFGQKLRLGRRGVVRAVHQEAPVVNHVTAEGTVRESAIGVT